jgi:hypothetical protein
MIRLLEQCGTTEMRYSAGDCEVFVDFTTTSL